MRAIFKDKLWVTTCAGALLLSLASVAPQQADKKTILFFFGLENSFNDFSSIAGNPGDHVCVVAFMGLAGDENSQRTEMENMVRWLDNDAKKTVEHCKSNPYGCSASEACSVPTKHGLVRAADWPSLKVYTYDTNARPMPAYTPPDSDLSALREDLRKRFLVDRMLASTTGNIDNVLPSIDNSFVGNVNDWELRRQYRRWYLGDHETLGTAYVAAYDFLRVLMPQHSDVAMDKIESEGIRQIIGKKHDGLSAVPDLVSAACPSFRLVTPSVGTDGAMFLCGAEAVRVASPGNILKLPVPCRTDRVLQIAAPDGTGTNRLVGYRVGSLLLAVDSNEILDALPKECEARRDRHAIRWSTVEYVDGANAGEEGVAKVMKKSELYGENFGAKNALGFKEPMLVRVIFEPADADHDRLEDLCSRVPAEVQCSTRSDSGGITRIELAPRSPAGEFTAGMLPRVYRRPNVSAGDDSTSEAPSP